MYDKLNLAYILTSLEAVEKIFLYTSEFEDLDIFFWANDQLNFNAKNNLLLVIGEETKKIDKKLRKEFPEIPWRQISGLTNNLAHHYRGVNPGILFKIVKNHLPPLKGTLIQMIDRVKFNRDLLEKILATNHYKNLKYLLK